MIPVIAIVGRPNVGKSSLFNRILGRCAAVVDDVPGVTRDRNYRPFLWQDRRFLLVDTGGMVMSEKEMLHRSVNAQIDQAVAEAAAVLFVVEAGCGITAEDEHMARLLRKKAADKTILIVNKAESPRHQHEMDVFLNLGLGKPWPVSALHGSNVAEVLDEVAERIGCSNAAPGEQPPESGDPPLRIAIVGRPNVGKSSFVNKLLGRDRMIVDDEAGTTRDSVDSEMEYNGRRVVLIDTAGLRKKSHIKQDLEYYFNLRAIRSIERCDVCVVVVDATGEIGVQDLRIVGKALEMRKGMLLAFNKWDAVEKNHKTFDRLVADVKQQFQELRPLPMFAISALTGRRLTAVVDEAFKIKERMVRRLPSAEFEDTLFTWVRAHPHPAIPQKPVRFLGARQLEAPCPLFRIIATNHRKMADSYVRFLMNKIYDTYDFTGCPVVLEFRGVTKPGRPAKPRYSAEKQ